MQVKVRPKELLREDEHERIARHERTGNGDLVFLGQRLIEERAKNARLQKDAHALTDAVVGLLDRASRSQSALKAELAEARQLNEDSKRDFVEAFEGKFAELRERAAKAERELAEAREKNAQLKATSISTDVAQFALDKANERAEKARPSLPRRVGDSARSERRENIRLGKHSGRYQSLRPHHRFDSDTAISGRVQRPRRTECR